MDRNHDAMMSWVRSAQYENERVSCLTRHDTKFGTIIVVASQYTQNESYKQEV